MNPKFSEMNSSDLEICAREGVTAILQLCGENPDRDGLQDTPRRVVKAWREMTAGYAEDPAVFLSVTFEQDEGTPYDEMIVLRDVDFRSVCEHHVLPFIGKGHIAYIPQPGGKIVGLSKLARVLDCYARRFQVQERLTAQVASAIDHHLQPLGVIVVLEAHHSCMGCRGAHKAGAVMATSALRGVFKENPAARSEALRLMGVGP